MCFFQCEICAVALKSWETLVEVTPFYLGGFFVCFLLEDPSMTHFSVLTQGTKFLSKISRPLSTVKWSCIFSCSMFPPPCLTVGMVVFGSYSAFLFLQTWQVELMPKIQFWFRLTTALSPKLSLNHSPDKFKSGLLEQKNFTSIARFQSIRE